MSIVDVIGKRKSKNSARAIGRPTSVTLLAVMVLIITTLNLVRGWQAIAQQEFLLDLLPIPWLYVAISGFVWGLVGIILFLGLWLGFARFNFYAALATLLYSAYYWVDRFMLTLERDQANLPFAIVLNLIIILLTFWILSRRRTMSFFGELND